jgi:O-acetylserine/cysteine efflux transporter
LGLLAGIASAVVQHRGARESAMSLKDLLLVLLVVCAWGVNFVVIKVGLHGMSPMLLGAFRFLLAAVPAVFFVKRPQLPLRWLLAYGMTVSFGQFAFLFSAMYLGMPAGLASLVMQAQAFFTMGLAVLFLKERVHARQVLGLLVAASGLALIASAAGHSMTLIGFVLTLVAALLWATGNIIMKKIGAVDPVGLVVWSSLIPPVPFLLLSYWLEGPQRMVASLAGFNASSAFAIVYLAGAATLLGYILWSRLMMRYPASTVAPFSLLVPVLGMASATLLLDEHLSPLQLAGAALVMGGLLLNVFGGWMFRRLSGVPVK